MGYEYKLEVKNFAPSMFEKFITTLPGNSHGENLSHTYEYRASGQPHEMPDAVITAEPYGFYFCANSKVGKEFLGIVICDLVSYFEAIEISDLE